MLFPLIFKIIVGYLISSILHGIMEPPSSDSASANSRTIYVQAHGVFTMSHSQLFVSDFFFYFTKSKQTWLFSKQCHIYLKNNPEVPSAKDAYKEVSGSRRG